MLADHVVGIVLGMGLGDLGVTICVTVPKSSNSSELIPQRL